MSTLSHPSGKRAVVLLCLAMFLASLAIWERQASAPTPKKIPLPPRRVSFAPAPRAVENPPKAVLTEQPATALPLVEAVQIGLRGGFYESPFKAEMQCATPGAVLHYTTDGSQPTGAAPVYSGPIPIDHTTVLRAAAFAPGWAASKITTRTYVFPNDVIASPQLRPSITKDPVYGPQMRAALLAIPSLSLVTSTPIQGDAPNWGRGRETKTKLAKASLEWLAPGGEQGFQADCGVEYYGGKVTPFQKKSFRLHFRREFGASKLKFPLFAGHEHGLAAVAEFDQLELRSGSHDMVQRGFYVSNIFADDSLLEMGHLSPHGRFVHLYLNGAYWGVYHLRERWGAAMHHRYLGGTKADYESINGNANNAGWDPGHPYDGDGRTWARVLRLRGNYSEVKQWVDVPDYIDYMLLFIYGRCEDEYRCVGTTVPGNGFQFYLNDADGFFQSPAHPWYGEPSNRTARRTPGHLAGDGPGSLFSMLLAEGDPDYLALLADRIYRAYFSSGALTFSTVSNRLKVRCGELEKAFVAEAARWAYRQPADWQEVRDDVFNRWLPSRAADVLGQLRAAGLYPALDAPVLNRQGGAVPNGFEVRFQNPGRGIICFTVDGSDPRMAGERISPAARRYAPEGQTGEALRINRNTIVKSRVRDGNQWSALNEAFFETGPSGIEPGEIRITELNLDSKLEGAGFVELGNASARAINLRGMRFTAGIAYAFPDHRDTILAPGQKLVLVKDLFRFRQGRGLEVAVEGVYTRKKQGGDRVTLSLPSGQIVTTRRI